VKAGEGLPTLATATTKFLCIDPSASHLAYVMVDLDKESKIAYLDTIGMLWTKDSWTKGGRFLYMNRCLDALVDGVSGAVPEEAITEQFFMNPKLRSGVGVIPVINGLIEKTCAEVGMSYYEVPPPSWRSVLGVKHINKPEGGRDYKTPTKVIVERHIGLLPDEIKSNVTMKPRTTPHDIYDALGIALAICIKNGYCDFKLSNTAYHNFNLIEKFNQIAKEIGNVKEI